MARAKRQLEIAGAERASIPELDDAVAAYVEVLYQRQALQQKEIELKAGLQEQLLDVSPGGYTYEDGEFRYEVKVESKTKVRVKRTKLDED